MTRFRNVNGEEIAYTETEELERDAEELKAESKALDKWRDRVSSSKIDLVRAMRAAGIWPQVRAALELADEDTQEDWAMLTVIPRNDPMFAAFAGALGFDDAAIDALFPGAPVA